MSDQELQERENAGPIMPDATAVARASLDVDVAGLHGGDVRTSEQSRIDQPRGHGVQSPSHGRSGLFQRMSSAVSYASKSAGLPPVESLHPRGAAHSLAVVLPTGFANQHAGVTANLLGSAIDPAIHATITSLAASDPAQARQLLETQFAEITQRVSQAGDAVALNILRQAAHDPINAARYYFAAAQRVKTLLATPPHANAEVEQQPSGSPLPAPDGDVDGERPTAQAAQASPAGPAVIVSPQNHSRIGAQAPAANKHTLPSQPTPQAAVPEHAPTQNNVAASQPAQPLAAVAQNVSLRSPSGGIAELANINIDIGETPGVIAPTQISGAATSANDNTVGYALPSVAASPVAMRRPQARQAPRRQARDFRAGYSHISQDIGQRSHALARSGSAKAQQLGQQVDHAVTQALSTDASHAATLTATSTTPTQGVVRSKPKSSHTHTTPNPPTLDAIAVDGEVAAPNPSPMLAPLPAISAASKPTLTAAAVSTGSNTPDTATAAASFDSVTAKPSIQTLTKPSIGNATPKLQTATQPDASAMQAQFDGDTAALTEQPPTNEPQAAANKNKIRAAATKAQQQGGRTKATARANASQGAAHQQLRNSEGKKRGAAAKTAATAKKTQQDIEAANALAQAKEKLRQDANQHAEMALAMLNMTAEQRDKLFQDTLNAAELAANTRFATQRDESGQALVDNKLKLKEANTAALASINGDCDKHLADTTKTMAQLEKQLATNPKKAAQTALDLGKRDCLAYKATHDKNLKDIKTAHEADIKAIDAKEQQTISFWQGKADASVDDPEKHANATSQIAQVKSKAAGERTARNSRATNDNTEENAKFTKLDTERKASAQRAHDEIRDNAKAYLAKIVEERATLLKAIETERKDGIATANARMQVDEAALTRMQKDEYATLEVQLKTELEEARIAAASAKKDSAGKSIQDKVKAKQAIELARNNAFAKIDAANADTMYLAQMEVDYAHSEINNSIKDLGTYTVKAVRDISTLQTKLERSVDDTTGKITARANSAIAAQQNIAKSVGSDLAEMKSTYHGGSPTKFHSNLDAEKLAVKNLRERDKEYFAALQAKRDGKPPDWDKKRDKAKQSIRDAVTISGGDPSKIQAALLEATNGDPKLIAEILNDPTVSRALVQMAATDNGVWRGPMGTFDNWSSIVTGKVPSNPTVDAIKAMALCKDRNEVKAKMLDQAFNGGLTGWGYDSDLINKIYESTPPGERDTLDAKFKTTTGKSLAQQHASENQTSGFFSTITGNGERSDGQKMLDAQWAGRDQGIAEAKRQAASGGTMGSVTKFVQGNPALTGLAVVMSGGVLAGPALAVGSGQLDGIGNNVSGYLAQNDKIREEVEIKPDDSYETRMEKQRRQRELFGNIDKYLAAEGTSTETLDHNVASSSFNKSFGSTQRLEDALTAMRQGDFKSYSMNLGAYQQETAFGDHKKAADEGKRAREYGYGAQYREFQANAYCAKRGLGKSTNPEADYEKFVKENVNAVDANYIINQTQEKATDPDKAAKQIAARLVYAQFGGMTGWGNDTDALSEEMKNLPKDVRDKIEAEYARQCNELGLTVKNQSASSWFWGNTSTGSLKDDMNWSYNGVSGVAMQTMRNGISAVTGNDNVGLVSPLLADQNAGKSNEYSMAMRDLSLGKAETPAEQLARTKYSSELAKSGMLGTVGFGDAGTETEIALAKQQAAYDRLVALGLGDKNIEKLDPESLTPEQASALKAFQFASESAEGWQKVAITQQKSATEFVIDGVVTVVTVAAAVAAEVFTLGAATPIIITAVAGVMAVMAKSAALGGKFSGVEIDRGLISAAVQAVGAGLSAGKGLEQLSEQLVKNAGQKIARAIVKEVLEAAINAGANITQLLLDPATYAGSPEEVRARLLGAIKSAALQTGVSAVARGAIKGKLDLPENMSFGQKMLNDQLGYGGALDTAVQFDFTSNNPREEVGKVLHAAIQTGVQTAATHVAIGMYAKYKAGMVPGKGGVGSNGEIVVSAAEKQVVVDAILHEGGTVTAVPPPPGSDSTATVLMIKTAEGHLVPLVIPNEHAVVKDTKTPAEEKAATAKSTEDKPTIVNDEHTKTTAVDKVVSSGADDNLLTITDGKLSNEKTTSTATGSDIKGQPHSKLTPSDSAPVLAPADHTIAKQLGIPVDRADLRKMVAEKHHEVLAPFLDSKPTAHPEFGPLMDEFKKYAPGELGKPENKAVAQALIERWTQVAGEIAQRTGHDETALREIYNRVEKQDFPQWHENMAGLSPEAQAKLAHMQREELKLMVRDLMADAHSKEVLYLRDLALYGHRHGPQFEMLMQKALAKNPDQLKAYEKIIGSSKESNKGVNKNVTGDESGLRNTGVTEAKDKNQPVTPEAAKRQLQQESVGHGQTDLHSHWMGNVAPDAMLHELQKSSKRSATDVSDWEPMLREMDSLSSDKDLKKLLHKRGEDGAIDTRGGSGDALEIVAKALRDIENLKQKLERDAPAEIQERRRQDIDRIAKDAVEAALRSSTDTDFNSAYEIRDELVKRFYGVEERSKVMGDSETIAPVRTKLLEHFEGRPVVQQRIREFAANETTLHALEAKEKTSPLNKDEREQLKNLRTAKALIVEQFAYDRYSIDTLVRLAQDKITYTEQSNSAKKLVERFDPEQMVFIKEIAKREHPELANDIDALVVKHLAMITSNNFGDRDQGVDQRDISPQAKGMSAEAKFQESRELVKQLAKRDDVAGLDVAGAEYFAFNEHGQQRFQQMFGSLFSLAKARNEPVVFRPHVGEGGIDVVNGNHFSTDRNRQVDSNGEFTHVVRARENIGQLLDALDGIAKNFGGKLPPEVVVRFGHATHATPEQIARMKKLGVMVEVNLTSNQVTGSLGGDGPAAGGQDAQQRKRDSSKSDSRTGQAHLEEHALGSLIFHDIDVVLSTDGHDVMDTHLAKEYSKAKNVVEDIREGLLAVKITVAQAQQMNADVSTSGRKVVIPDGANPNDILQVKYADLSDAKRALFDQAYGKFFETANRYSASASNKNGQTP